jgi:hypothetical protein
MSWEDEERPWRTTHTCTHTPTHTHTHVPEPHDEICRLHLELHAERLKLWRRDAPALNQLHQHHDVSQQQLLLLLALLVHLLRDSGKGRAK